MALLLPLLLAGGLPMRAQAQVPDNAPTPDTAPAPDGNAPDPDELRQDAQGGPDQGSAWDALTTAAVKMRLVGNPNIPGMAINVDTTGGVVTLFGVVPTDEVADLAEQEAQQARGVSTVRNELQVVPEEQQEAVRSADDDLARKLAERMRLENAPLYSEVDFEVHNGVVRVTGDVPSPRDRAQILEMTRGMQGVRSVLDDMTFEGNARQPERPQEGGEG